MYILQHKSGIQYWLRDTEWHNKYPNASSDLRAGVFRVIDPYSTQPFYKLNLDEICALIDNQPEKQINCKKWYVNVEEELTEIKNARGEVFNLTNDCKITNGFIKILSIIGPCNEQ